MFVMNQMIMNNFARNLCSYVCSRFVLGLASSKEQRQINDVYLFGIFVIRILSNRIWNIEIICIETFQWENKMSADFMNLALKMEVKASTRFLQHSK